MQACRTAPWILLVFTDGACEPSPGTATGLRAGHGAVVYDPESRTARYFGGQHGDPIVRRFTKEGAKTQVVGQAELLPCIAAKELWSDLFKERFVIWLIDSDAARFCLIKGGSPTKESAWLATKSWESEVRCQSHSWFERVASPSNWGDDPSRGKEPATLLGIAPSVTTVPTTFEDDLCEAWPKDLGHLARTGATHGTKPPRAILRPRAQRAERLASDPPVLLSRVCAQRRRE